MPPETFDGTSRLMDPVAPSVTEAEFALLVRHAGLSLDDEGRSALFEVYGHFEAMLARVRIPGPLTARDRAAEPAHLFVPGQGWDRP